MKRFAILLAATALATPAFAADIITEEPPAPAPVEIAPAYNWTGLYVGGQAGAAFGGSSGAIGTDLGVPLDAVTFQKDTDVGFTGGVHVGYDYQLPSNIIIGGVVDFNYIDNDRKVGVDLVDGTGDNTTFSNKVDLDYFGTVRGKVGYAFDRVAVYGTGGLAYGNPKNKVNDGEALALLGTGFTSDTNSDKDSIGYSVGGGVDFLATEKLSFGLEYLYTDLGKAKTETTFTNVATGDAFSVDTKTDVDFHTVMAKASYRFN
ncbi:outer membrane protein [Aureimonas leprariae]|uniref:Porin family protein n=1 Tax=Plantimonas leprariae TaxID=2615207 RepID=A0A7V7U029_9HYPH|nr:outer membrane beta-barrel protein [Aureimonas leprariae]KAB0680001.1 porin family protein [Aureimonas leprariae]